MIPFVIDNRSTRLAETLNSLLDQTVGKPFDIVTAYFSISGYRAVHGKIESVGAFRLLLGAEPTTGDEVGLKPSPERLKARLRGDLDKEPFTEETLRLVESLIGFLRADKVEVRLYGAGFLHAKAYLFHQDPVTDQNRRDRLRPYAAIVGSSNFTGPGLTTNAELNLVHRVFGPEDDPVDREAAARAGYLSNDHTQNTLLDPSGVDVPDGSRRAIKSEVGARAITDLTAWYEEQWLTSDDFKDRLIDLLDASKFGQKEYTPYEVYTKALYEYFRDELGDDASELGASAVELAEFQEDSVKKARRILTRYDGVLVADSVGLGKTWIGKKLLEDFAYHRRQKAVVVCPASLRPMWERELRESTIAAEIVGAELLGRDEFNCWDYQDADVLLVDESHNFRNDKAKRYENLSALIQQNGGRGRSGERKKLILLTATPINNDLSDIHNQIRLFTQDRPDYFREAGIGDLKAYFKRARKQARDEDTPAGVALFNLLEEFMVRNTRPYIRAAYPNATINGKAIHFPDRRLQTVEYNLGTKASGLYTEVAAAIESLSLAPYRLEAYRRKDAIENRQDHEWEVGRENALVGIFKTRFLKRLESSLDAFRLSVARALTFEETYFDALLDGRVVGSRDFQKVVRFLARDDEDEMDAGSLFGEIDESTEAKAYIDSLPKLDRNEFNLRELKNDVERDVAVLKSLLDRLDGLSGANGKVEKLKDLLAGDLKGQKVLIFSTFKDTARALFKHLDGDAKWKKRAGEPVIRRIDSANHVDDRADILWRFAPVGSNREPPDSQIDILISTDVLSEGQNLQDCGNIVNFDLTWNPIRLVQRNGRIDRLGSPHDRIRIFNLFPEKELESLLKLVERLMARIAVIDKQGMLDSSILGEEVHPRTFNTLRRIREEDGAVLTEEEERAELAGPELLLKHLKDQLGREGKDRLDELPNGIHSGLRREKCHGMFFYFQAPRADGEGKRHYWRYIDATTHEIEDNRFEIARRIECPRDEPRYITPLDVFNLQDRVVERILAEDRQTEDRVVAGAAVDPTQQSVALTLRESMNRSAVDRERIKECLRYLKQPLGKPILRRLSTVYASWKKDRDDAAFLKGVEQVAADFAASPGASHAAKPLTRDDLDLICFEYLSS